MSDLESRVSVLEKQIADIIETFDGIAGAIIGAQKTPGLTGAPKIPEPKKQVIDSPQALLGNFPQNLAEKLNVSDFGNQWWITKAYDKSEQGKTEWTKVNAVVKELAGRWVPAGKDSRWEVPK